MAYLRDCLVPQSKSKIKAGDGMQFGEYRFFTSSPIQSKYYHTATYDQPALIFGTGGNASVHYCDEPFATSTDCLVMYGAKGSNLELIYHYLHTNLHLLQAGFKGAGLQHISKEYILDISIDLPEGNEQNQLLTEIRIIDSLINARHKQLSKLDELVKSRFIEMFGEVETNVKGFPMKQMDECCKFIGGAQPDKSHFEYEKTDDNIRLIQIRDYKSDRFITYIPKSMARKTCTATDIMIGRYGPPIFQILGGIEGAYNVALMKAVPTAEFNTEYFRYFLKSEKLLHYLESFSQRTAGQDGIQIDKLNAYPCFVPPIELQNQFTAFVEQVDKSKFEIQQSLDKLETLKKALMQKYFG